MTTVQGQKGKYSLRVELAPTEKAALDAVVERFRVKFPLFTITQSDVIRQLIADAAYRCPKCNTPTIPRLNLSQGQGEHCQQCGEPLLVSAIPAQAQEQPK